MQIILAEYSTTNIRSNIKNRIPTEKADRAKLRMRNFCLLMQRNTIFVLLLALAHLAMENHVAKFQKREADPDGSGRLDSDEDTGNTFYHNVYMSYIYIHINIIVFISFDLAHNWYTYIYRIYQSGKHPWYRKPYFRIFDAFRSRG